MKKTLHFSFLIPLIFCGSAIFTFSQTQGAQAPSSAAETTPSVIVNASPTPTPTPTPKSNFVKNLVRDQKEILISPLRFRKADLKWFVPLALVTTALVITDRETSSWVSNNGTLSWASYGVSRGGNVFIAGGFASGLYFIGKATNHPHLQKTGKLAFEALVGTGIIIGILKNTTQRPPPNFDSGSGRFFERGTAFPSGHSSTAWAVATVIAYEYRKRPLIRYAAIAAALAISLSRYSGRAHFMSEVLVGSAIGFGIGRFVYMAHH